jgi:LPXTG-motif cell wall-anchored protein
MSDSAEYTWLHSQEQVLGRLASPFTHDVDGWSKNDPNWHADVRNAPASQDGQDWLIRAYKEHGATIPPVATTKEMAIAYLMRVVDLATEASIHPESNPNDPERSDGAYAAKVLGWVKALSPAAAAAKEAGQTTEQIVAATAKETTSNTTLYAIIGGVVVFSGVLFLAWKKKKRLRSAAAAVAAATRRAAAAASAAIPAMPLTPAAAAAAGLGCLCGAEPKRHLERQVARIAHLSARHPELRELKEAAKNLKKALEHIGYTRAWRHVR